MTYPPQGDNSGQGNGYTDYSSQSGYNAQSAYGQGAPGQSGYGQSGYGQSGYAQADYAAQNPSFGNAGAAQIGPPSNVGWAVASILFFWPLSFVAMTRALQVYPLWAAGRHAEAEAASATAKKLGMISLALVALLIVLYVVFLFILVGAAATAGY
ncbi:CD225/dispanin family protein [uncultured Dietzia sp.]|uniref:CD225/dispanin family protein n=1 Tax=uncultured Dietzia sp. TaxID=395519 RepID=UPI0025F6F782|nr:CD225/dispanin family protein [uncultured Dietzia sp.]